MLSPPPLRNRCTPAKAPRKRQPPIPNWTCGGYSLSHWLSGCQRDAYPAACRMILLCKRFAYLRAILTRSLLSCAIREVLKGGGGFIPLEKTAVKGPRCELGRGCSSWPRNANCLPGRFYGSRLCSQTRAKASCQPWVKCRVPTLPIATSFHCPFERAAFPSQTLYVLKNKSF